MTAWFGWIAVLFLSVGCATSEDRALTSKTMVDIKVHKTMVEGSELHYLEAGADSSHVVLFLHGARFSKDTWKELGSLEFFARRGYRAIAVDLPGYGASAKSRLEPVRFLAALFDELRLDPCVLVSPSMSGRYSLPFVATHASRLRGFVPVAPAGISHHASALRGSTVPTLIVWGSEDRVFPVQGAATLAGLFEHAKVEILDGARHPCYLDQPERFHQVLLDFLAGCFED